MRRQVSRERWIVIGMSFVIVGVFAIIGWRAVGVMRSRPLARLSPKPLELTHNEDQSVVQTACYGFVLPKEFETSSMADCTTNSYARPRKYQYINVAPYYGTTSDDLMIARWRDRWLNLGATERDLSSKVVAGKAAWRVVDFYPQNQQSFVTYLVRLPHPVRIDSSEPVSAIEIRGWATSDSDRQLIEAVIASWQWRL